MRAALRVARIRFWCWTRTDFGATLR